MLAKALTIAGSDSGGGAGIQGDLKTFTVHRVFGASVITAVTAQNTVAVTGVVNLAAEFVRLQIDTVMEDIGADAIKTGMLPNRELIGAVADALERWPTPPLVVDPVMVAQSGAQLMDDDARALLVERLFPRATLITPNLPEAEALLGRAICGREDMRQAAIEICRLGAPACLLKGGHGHDDDAVDVFAHHGEVEELSAPRLPSRHTHGTGCQLSAAITANLALGCELRPAIRAAKEFISRAIAHGLAIGQGAGPANPLAWLDRRS